MTGHVPEECTKAGLSLGLEHTGLHSVAVTPERRQKCLLTWGPYNTDCRVPRHVFPIHQVWGGAQESGFLACF